MCSFSSISSTYLSTLEPSPHSVAYIYSSGFLVFPKSKIIYTEGRGWQRGEIFWKRNKLQINRGNAHTVQELNKASSKILDTVLSTSKEGLVAI